jgi:2-(1,2-epoxy-1,2-dihydrophenyl)acetyl-CoA isomerase
VTEARGVRHEIDGKLGRIVLDRPQAANAFDMPAAEALGQAVTALAASDIRAVLVTGEGKRFCAGGDVASFGGASDRAAHLWELATVLEANLRRMSALPVPVVAAVQGAVAGAGLAFVLNADLVVAARSTKFVMAYSGIGLTPDCGVSYLLPRVVGVRRALTLALANRVLTAEEALAWGLVSEVVEDDVLAVRGAELAAHLAAGPAQAFAETKRLMRGCFAVSREENALDEARTISAMLATEDAGRLVDAFLAR